MKIYLKDYQSPAYAIDGIHLHFNLHETKTIVTSTLKMTKLKEEPLVLQGVQLKLLAVELNGKKYQDYLLTPETLSFSNNILGNSFELKTSVEINPEENKSCEGLYLSNGIFCTQCEAESFRKITYMLDRPDVMTVYTVEIEADQSKYPQLLSNGDRIQAKVLGGGRHSVSWNDPFKKPSYLFALVAGDMGVITDTFTTCSGKKVILEVFASHGKQERCLHAMQSLKKSMTWDEVRFGLEYDLNQFMIVAIDDFNMGAMENKGLNVFNSRLVLADSESATDDDFEAIESVVGHEYFHNWTGNRITCRNWFELSLKEGLTVFRDQEFSADMNSRPVQRIKDVNSLRSRQFTEDAGPNAHPVRPSSCLAVDNFYTATIYEKGAEIIRMMQTIVGREGFRRGMDEYFKRHDGQAVTINEFAAAISEPNAVDFTQFKNWYSQAGTPEVTVTEDFNSQTMIYSLTLRQSCELTQTEKKEGLVKQPFHIPLMVGLIDSTGNEIKIESENVVWNSDHKPVLHLKEIQQTFLFEGLNEKPILSLNREFSAPVKIIWETDLKNLLHLIKFDTDAFNKYEIAQKILLLEVRQIIKSIQSEKPVSVNIEIIDSIASVLNDIRLDSAFKALMLALPSDSTLTMEEDILDGVTFEKARQYLRESFVSHCGAVIFDHYKKLSNSKVPGDRSLKNKLLGYLVRTEFPNSQELATLQYDNALNMTDSIYALSYLSETKTPQRDHYLQHFFNRWSKDSVVFNKWLSVQASSPAPDTFQRVQEIAQSSFFNGQNPNNIYSLHGAFSKNNILFNSDEGGPYTWYCSEILKIDAWNPQLAARLCSTFNFVKKLPALQKEKAFLDIKKLLSLQTLSKNSRELLEKCI